MAGARTLSRNDYTVGWICALPVERASAKAVLDEVHRNLPVPSNDQNTYTLGRIGNHNIVVACLPNGEYGIASAATVVTQLLSSFPSIRFGLMVGIGGGVPSNDADVRLGDIVVSKPTRGYGGVVQYDYGKAVNGSLERTGALNRPPRVLLTALAELQANHMAGDSRIRDFLSEMSIKLGQNASNFNLQGQKDQLYHADYEHVMQARTCDLCDETQVVSRTLRTRKDPVIHYGLIASGNQVVKDSHLRDRLGRELGVYCVETEAAGLMNDFPCLVIRGISDYADSHKNKEWQGYAAAVAAVYAKELLLTIATTRDTPLAYRNFNIPLDLSRVPASHHFVGRDEDLDTLWNLLQPSASARRRVAVLHGLGGIGKTQLAIHFARLHQDDFSAIFWLNGKSQEMLIRSFASFLPNLPNANMTVDPTTDDEIKQAAKQVLQWLSIPSNSQWLLIFDNIDKYSPVEEPDNDFYDILPFFPSTDHGSIIITTRLPQLSELGQSCPVRKLQFQEGTALLINSSGLTMKNIEDIPSLHLDMSMLSSRLDGLPLAIVTAGSYIRQTGISPSKYLELYSHSWLDLQRGVRSHHYYSNGNLVGTWMISYQEIKTKAPYAAKLLLLLACYDNQDIWYDLIHQGLQDENAPLWLREVASNEIRFSYAMRELLSYSLIELKPALDSYSVHPVVQDWCKSYMEEENSREEMMAIAIISIGFSVASSDDLQYWISQQRVLPHANRMIQELQNRERLSEQPTVLDAMHRLGGLYVDQCKFQEAEKIYRQTLAGKEKVLGLDHRSTLHTVHYLGDLYRRQDKLKEAEKMLQRALSGYIKTLGPDDPSTLHVNHSLGETYFLMDKLQEAEKMYQQALAGREKALGPDHVSTLATVHRLGSYYRRMDRLQDAEEMLRRAQHGREEVLGPAHILTLETVYSLGNLYAKEGKLQEAENLFQRALEGTRKALGANHTSTLSIVHQMGGLYKKQGRLQEAERSYQQALAGTKEVLGPNHGSTLDVVHDIGLLYAKQDRLQEAATMYQQALAGSEKTLGPNHSFTLDIIHNMGNLYLKQNKLQEAETMFQQALVGTENVLGPNHSATMDTVHCLGDLYSKQNRLQEAEKMYLRALAGTEKAMGPTHSSTLDTVHQLGNVYMLQGRLQEAEKLYLQALVGSEKELGPDHTSTLYTINNLGILYEDLNNLQEAEKMYSRALAGKEKVLGPNHTSTLGTVQRLGNLNMKQGKLREAEEMYQRDLAGTEKALGLNHHSIRGTLQQLEKLYKKQGRFQEAQEMHNKRSLISRDS